MRLDTLEGKSSHFKSTYASGFHDGVVLFCTRNAANTSTGMCSDQKCDQECAEAYVLGIKDGIAEVATSWKRIAPEE